MMPKGERKKRKYRRRENMEREYKGKECIGGERGERKNRTERKNFIRERKVAVAKKVFS